MPDLPRALGSLLAQDESNIEIVISDNASEDGTGEYCRSIAEADERVRYLRNATNIGSAANFQRVVDLSESSYFAWAAHDDWYAPNLISSCLDVLLSNPNSGLCVPARRRVDENRSLISVRYEPEGLSSRDLETRLRAHLWRRGWLTLYGLWRKEMLTRIGPPEPVFGTDVILLWRALLLAPIEVINEPLADYQVIRMKSPDAIMFDMTGKRFDSHFPNASLLRNLKVAIGGLGLNSHDTEVAEAVLRKWMLTHHYHELIATDLLAQSRRARARGSKVRAAALLAPAALLGPRMVLRRARQLSR